MSKKMELTKAQIETLENAALAGLTFTEVMGELDAAAPIQWEDEGAFFRLYAKMRRRVKMEFAKVVRDTAQPDNPQSFEASKFWLTHVGGWSPSKPMDLQSAGVKTLEDVQAVRDALDAIEQRLLGNGQRQLAKNVDEDQDDMA